MVSNSTRYSWPVFVHAFLARYCTKVVLSSDYDKVTRMVQRESETEAEYADRMHGATPSCPDVFTKHSLIHIFVKVI